MGNLLKTYSDLDLDLILTMLNIEVVRAGFMYYNEFQIHVPRLISLLCYHAKTHTKTHTWTHTHIHQHTPTHTHTHARTHPPPHTQTLTSTL